MRPTQHSKPNKHNTSMRRNKKALPMVKLQQTDPDMSMRRDFFRTYQCQCRENGSKKERSGTPRDFSRTQHCRVCENESTGQFRCVTFFFLTAGRSSKVVLQQVLLCVLDTMAIYGGKQNGLLVEGEDHKKP